MAAVATQSARPYPFVPNWTVRGCYALLFLYCLYALNALDISVPRVISGLGIGAKFIGDMFPPNFSRYELLIGDMIETLQISIISSFLGIALSLPVGLFSARNLMPAWVTWPTRIIIIVCRSFHPVIFAILFVKAVGFGALAGILTLIFSSIGFIGKLFSEAIEEISLKQVEAVRATGAPFMSVLTFAVLPQVLNRFIGFALYQTDANLRNSTMIGIVGAGGIGGTLASAFQRFDYDFVSAILIAIIVVIMVAEYLSVKVKMMYQ